MEAVQEILQFLDLNTRIDLKGTALESILGLTASEEGANLLSNVKELFMLLVTTSALFNLIQLVTTPALFDLIQRVTTPGLFDLIQLFSSSSIFFHLNLI